MNKETIEKAAAKAIDLVNGVPESYRKHAFHIVFSNLLGSEVPHATRIPKGAESIPKKSSVSFPIFKDRKELIDIILKSGLDYSPYNKILESGTWAERAMVILYVLETEMGFIGGLSPPEFEKLMKEQLRLPHVYRQNIYRDLAQDRENFIRVKEGRGNKYNLTIKAKNKIQTLLRGIESE